MASVLKENANEKNQNECCRHRIDEFEIRRINRSRCFIVSDMSVERIKINIICPNILGSHFSLPS